MESIRGKMVGTIPWDNSSRNVKINSVSGIPLTEPQVTHGGQGWVRDIEHNAANIGGANAKGAATAIQNKINAASELGEKLGGSGEVVLSPGTGAKFSDNFSVPVFNVYKDLYDQAELPKTILQKHSDFLRNVPKTNPKTKEVSYPFSNAPDINSPEMKEFALQNPNFRKQFLMEMQKPRSEKLLGYNTDDIYNAMTDPNLRDVPAGYMGHTLINVKKDAPVTPSSNSTYAYNMYGNYGGSLEHTPNEVFLNKAYNDNFNILRQKYPNAPEKKIHDMALGALDKRGEGVFELMNDEAINRIGQYHEGLKRGKFDPSDYKNALDYLKTPGVYAEGGLVNLAGGGSPKAKIAKYSISQIPEIAKALEEYLKGNITKAQHMEAVRKHLPVRQWNELPPYYTEEQVVNALTTQQRPKAFIDVPPGMQTGSRLDIRAYEKDPSVYVDTVHDSKGKPFSYNRTGHSTDVRFSSKPNTFYRVGLGTKEQALTPMGVERGMSKTPQAMMKGTNVGTSDEEVRRMMAEMLNDPAYTQIGMDPRVGSQFYDKATDRPIWTSGEKLQSGPLVIVPKKDIDTTDWNDPRLLLEDFPGKTYAEGGLIGYAPGGKVGALANLTKFLSESKIPQRLYHGTAASEKGGAQALSQLKQSKEGALGAGVYMTPNPEFASSYAERAGGYVMPLHTNLQNPLIINSYTDLDKYEDPMKAALRQLGVDPKQAEKIVDRAYESKGYIGKEVMSRAQKQGYDGLAQYRDGELNEVVSYNPMNIKSATGNTGEFNPYDPRLSKKHGGKVKKK
jgi:hypothetical protein